MKTIRLWSTISTWRWATILLGLIFFLGLEQSPAATIKISQEPSSSVQAADPDLFLIDIYQGLDTNSQPFYVTKKITWSLLRTTLTNYFGSNAITYLTLISSNAFFTNTYVSNGFFTNITVLETIKAKTITVTNVTIQAPGALSNLNWTANQLIGANSNQVAVTFTIGTGLALNTTNYTLNVGGFTPYSVVGANSQGLATSFLVGNGLFVNTNSPIDIELNTNTPWIGPITITNPPGQSVIILGANNTTNLSVSGVSDLVKLWVEGYIRDFGLNVNQLVATDGSHQLTSVTLGSGLSYDSGSATLSATGSGGTVTSVAIAGAQGLTSAGGPIIGSGTITVGASGAIVTNGNSFALVLSNSTAIDATHSLSLSNATASQFAYVNADNTISSKAIANGDLPSSGQITVTGTANQVNVSGSPVAPGGTVTLSTPQNIGIGNSPTFNAYNITNLIEANFVSPTNGVSSANAVDFSVPEATTNISGAVSFTSLSNFNPTNNNRAIRWIVNRSGSNQTITVGTWETDSGRTSTTTYTSTNNTTLGLLFGMQQGQFTNVLSVVSYR